MPARPARWKPPWEKPGKIPAHRPPLTDVPPPPASPLPEKLGPFEVLREIGRGGMGIVYEGRDSRLDRPVAIKVLPDSVVNRPDALERFEREMKAVARLSHPNIVAAYHAGQDEGVHYLAMEFVPGTDLHARIKTDGTVSPAIAVEWILQAARGLNRAHEAGIVHRDIKPGNLLVNADGRVKILDIGLARIDANNPSQSTLTQSGAVMGTVDFMAPEQATELKHVDHRADIYSLGCTFFYLLTGVPAYEGETLFRKMQAHVEAPVPKLSEFCPEADQNLSRMFEKMVAKSPDDRYQSMTAVIAALEKWQTALEPNADGESRPGRRPALILAILALTAAAAWLGWEKFHAAVPPDSRLLEHGIVLFSREWQLDDIISITDQKLTAAQFHPVDGSIHYATEWMNDQGTRRPGGIFRVEPDGSHTALLSAEAFHFAFSNSGDHLFFQESYRGKIGEFDTVTGQIVRAVDMSPADDDPVSPEFPPPWYRGKLVVEDGEYLFADFGNKGLGGIWKFGSALPQPVQIFDNPDSATRFQALTFGPDAVYAVTTPDVAQGSASKPGALHRFDGTRLEAISTDPPLRLPASVVWNPAADTDNGELFYADFNGHSVLRIVLPKDQSGVASVTPLISGFRELSFSALQVSRDGRRLLVVDWGAATVYVFRRAE